MLRDEAELQRQKDEKMAEAWWGAERRFWVLPPGLEEPISNEVLADQELLLLK